LKRYLRAVVTSDGEVLSEPLKRSLKHAGRRVEARHPDLPPGLAHDVGVLTAIAMVMLSLKMLKTLPGLPFAPGHKNAVLLPLYLLAADLTRSRFGATSAGLTMGILSFLMGDGRYGIFEIFKHVTPGLMTDLIYPLVRRVTRPSVLVLALLGVVLAAGRFATELGVALALGVPKSFYAYIGGVAVTHLVAGALSGFLSRVLLLSADRLRAQTADPPTAGAPQVEDPKSQGERAS
jgi:hypothetical protein